MSWNGSMRTAVRVPTGVRASDARRPRASRRIWVLAAALSAVACVVAVWTYGRTASEPATAREQTRKAPTRIGKAQRPRTVLPEPVAQRQRPADAVPAIQDLGFGFYTNRQGQVKARTRPPFVIHAAPSRQLFSMPAENQLDAVANTPLGADFYDDDVPEDFEEQFAASLTNRIEITGDDTPRDIERKQRVIRAKETLVALKRDGADLREVLLKEKKALIKMHEDYRTFEEGLQELRANDAPAVEVAEYAMAAKLLMQQRELEEPLSLDYLEQEAYDRIEALISPKENTNEAN